MINFEWTVKLGDVLTMAGAAWVGLSVFYKRGRLDGAATQILGALQKDFDEMKREFRSFRDTITQVATQKAQIEFLMKWYDELRRGIGRVTDDG